MLIKWLLNGNSLLIYLLDRLSKSLDGLGKTLHGLNKSLHGLHIVLDRLSIRLNWLRDSLHLTILNGLHRLNRSLHVDGLLSVLVLHNRLLNLHSWHRIGSTCASSDNAVSIQVKA